MSAMNRLSHFFMALKRKRRDWRACGQSNFIISSPRSGSTWLQQSLNLHPDVICTENRLFGNFAEFWPNNDGTRSLRITIDEFVDVQTRHLPLASFGIKRPEYNKLLLARISQCMCELLKETTGRRYMFDKVTPYLGTSALVVQGIREIFPQANIFLLARDGRDVLTSGAFDWLLRNGMGTDRYRYFVEREKGYQLQRFFDDELIETWARYWIEPLESLLESDSMSLLIRYEDMIRDHGTVLSEIFSLCQIPGSEKQVNDCVNGSQFERMSGGRKQGENSITEKARIGIAGDWRNYFTRQDGQLYEQLAGVFLRKLGYTSSNNWYENLPETLNLGPQ